MEHLNLLQISSPADGLVYLNGSLAGELLGGQLSLCIPRGRFCLSFSPLEQTDGKVYLPFSRILDLSEEKPVILRDDGILSVYLLGEICCVQLSPPYASLPCLPYLVAAHGFAFNGQRMRAQVYFDRVPCFSLEENGRILFACTLPFSAESAKLSTAKIGNEFCVIAELEQAKKKALACLAVQSRKLLFCEEYEQYHLSAQMGLELFGPSQRCGYRMIRQYRENPEKPSIRLARLPEEPIDPARAFALAIQHRDSSTALSFLSPSLARELSFEDLLEFFGDAFPAPEQFCQPGELAFCEKLSEHIFFVRRFALELMGDKISNISER